MSSPYYVVDRPSYKYKYWPENETKGIAGRQADEPP
jgi:hypothetical protein